MTSVGSQGALPPGSQPHDTPSTAPSKQDLLNSFYSLDNLLTITVTIPDADWTALKAAEPRGGRCNFGFVGDRFDWFKATSVSITGTKFPAQQGTFSNIGIIKKSYCGSFSTTKPSLRLDFTHFTADNEKPVEKLIGIKTVTLNNCKQDDSFIRQPLGYELFKQAGVPYARCNFAKVIVNGVNMGVYLNLEPIKKTFLAHNFSGNDKGNAYELEVGEDLDPAIVAANKVSYEGFSDFEDQKDIKLAADKIAAGGLTAAQQFVDMDEFTKFFAMETLLKHWDGYTQNRNNTYIYNDTVAIASPTASDVKLKIIPCGIDQIMQEGRDFNIGSKAILSALVRNDAAATAKLYDQIRTYATTIFSRQNHDAVLKPMIDRMEALLATAGVQPSGPINVVRKQLKLIRSGAFQLLGSLPQDPTMWLSKATGECIHASASEPIVGGPPAPSPSQDVYHTAPTGAPSDTWIMAPATADPTYTTIHSGAYASWLYGDETVKTKGGHANVFVVNGASVPQGNGGLWKAAPATALEKWHATGYYVLKCKANGQYVYFSDTDLTSKGKGEVCLLASETDEGRFVSLF